MFWDSRARGLEAQALAPIESLEEMRGSGYVAVTALKKDRGSGKPQIHAERGSPVERLLQHQEDLSTELRSQDQEGEAQHATGFETGARLAEPLDRVDERVEPDTRRLAENRMLIRYDSRGCGHSSGDHFDYSLLSRLCDLEAVIAKHGGSLETFGHPTTTLEDMFLRIVAESKARPGRRYLPAAEEQGNGAPAGARPVR